MKTVEAKGKTVEEAINSGLEELDTNRDSVDIEIIDEGNKGIFGFFGGKEAKVKLSIKVSGEDIAREFVQDICQKMNIDVEIEIEKKGEYMYLNLFGPEMGVVIGRRGETLDAVQYLANLAVNKKLSQYGERSRVVIDAQGYRKKREITLKRLADKMSRKVKEKGSKVVLEPMNPQERRVIHTALQGDSEVETFSEGVEPYRKVVLVPKRKAESIKE